MCREKRQMISQQISAVRSVVYDLQVNVIMLSIAIYMMCKHANMSAGVKEKSRLNSIRYVISTHVGLSANQWMGRRKTNFSGNRKYCQKTGFCRKFCQQIDSVVNKMATLSTKLPTKQLCRQRNGCVVENVLNKVALLLELSEKMAVSKTLHNGFFVKNVEKFLTKNEEKIQFRLCRLE